MNNQKYKERVNEFLIDLNLELVLNEYVTFQGFRIFFAKHSGCLFVSKGIDEKIYDLNNDAEMRSAKEYLNQMVCVV